MTIAREGSSRVPELMNGRDTNDDRARVLAMSRAYVLSRAIHVVAELGVANHVGEEPVPVGELARLTGSHPMHLARLMRFLAGHGIFAECAQGEFAATNLSNVIRDDSPNSLRPGLRMVNAGWWAAVGALGHSVTTGEPAFAHMHEDAFFAWLKKNPDDQLRFDAGMASNSCASDEAIARAYDFSRAKLVIDVGGGRGGLVRAIVERHPGVKALLFDQPQVVKHSLLSTGGVLADRCSSAAGDFFQTVPSGAQVYVIKGVLHDFDDERCVAILRNCQRAMAPSGRILIVERFSAPDNRAHEAKTIDLLMMALLGGRERTIAEWEQLLRSAELRLVRHIPTASEFTIAEAGPV
jgi:C-methyltransferase